ncbi:unnamed protein product [Rotaria magnacalcarata]|uniref:FBXO47 ARM repeats region domain-containing protein n=5 Tax=Rotaria magnacalcarata TaxID=392030 RepID=A0A815GYQ7_9BILA|nr:unnamed protein product [Rotaria magnacalcarata]CAF3867970.1 unnamed protein product [Rotaria magnacalcarata]
MMSIGKRKYFSITDAVSSSSSKKKRFLQLTPFNVKQSVIPANLCYLSQIPIEMRDLILLKLSAHELHQLASTSNEYFSIVLNFLRSSMGTRYIQFVLHITPDRRRSGAWENLGRLYGLMTSLLPLVRRIQMIKEVLFNKLNLSDDGSCMEDLSRIGRFFGEATRHWSEREIAWAFSQLDSHLQLQKKVDRFYSCEHVGVEAQLEQSIRSCFRLVYFDSIRLYAHRGCLLNVILYKQPIWFQARLIYLLFGPMSLNKIDWEKFSRDRSDFLIYPNVDEEQAYFDLSRAFNVLNRSVHAQKAWNSNSKLALLNELLAQPVSWKSEYVAELLFYCGRELLTNVLIAFAMKNYHKEYAQLIQSLCLVARQRKAYYEIIQMAVEDSFERCTIIAQRNSIIIHLQNAFRCVTRNVIAVLASSTITPADQLHYLQQLEALDAQKAALISFLLTNQINQNN